MTFRRAAMVAATSLSTLCCAHANVDTISTAPEVRYTTAELANGDTVHFSSYFANRLLFIYSGQEREIPLCIKGRYEEDDLYLEDVEIPLIAQSTETAAAFNNANCQEDDDYIGMMHNHPSTAGVYLCGPSMVDFERFSNDEKAQVEVVICAADHRTSRFQYSLHIKKQ